MSSAIYKSAAPSRQAAAAGFKSKCMLSSLLVGLVLGTVFFAQALGVQKFVPNGRYGRRSDLPPLDIATTKDHQTDQLLAKFFLRQGVLVDDFQPLWCTPVDAKTNLFRCLERYFLDKYLQQMSKQSHDAGDSSVSSTQGQYQDQS